MFSAKITRGSFWLLLLLGFQTVLAQSPLRGKVYDALTKEPLPGIAVQVPNTTTGTTTDATGTFTLETTGNTLLVSGIGYRKQEVPVNGSTVTVALEPAVEDLQTIVVTASREAQQRTEAPMAISKLSPTLINDTKPTNIYEAINKTPGVVMVNYNNEQHGMSIRQPMGTSAYFLYLEDGIPIRPMGVFNHNALIEMNVLAISSVEVVKGPASSLYGPEAVGGAINFITHKPTAVPVARLGVQADQFGYRRVQFGTGGYVTPKLGLYGSGFVARQRDSWQARSNYDKISLNARADYQFSARTHLTGTASYNDYDSQTGGSVDSVAYYNRSYSSAMDFTYRKVEAVRSRLTLDHRWREGAESFVTAFYRFNDYGQNPSYSIRWQPGSTTARGEINTNRFHSYGVIAQHRQSFGFLQSKLLTGASYDYSPTDYRAYQIELEAVLREDKRSVEKYNLLRERPDLLNANYEADLQNSAVYAQYDFRPVPQLLLSLGARYDRMSFGYENFLDTTRGTKTYDQVTPKIGLTYELMPGRGVYANYSRGFSPPSLTSIFRKRANVAPGESPFFYNLEPAQFDNYEIGGWASFADNKVYLDWALYQMNGRNELLSVRLADNSTESRSAGKTLHRGVEYGLTFKPTTEWFFRFGGTNAIHKFVEFALSQSERDAVKDVNGKVMPQSPPWIANTELTYKPNWLKGFRASLEWQRISSWYQNQINTVQYDDRTAFGMKGVSVLHFRTGYEWKGLEVFLNVLNLTDELYANSVSRGNGPADRTTYNPAAPRTFVMGIQYNFAGKK